VKLEVLKDADAVALAAARIIAADARASIASRGKFGFEPELIVAAAKDALAEA
jgi:hypothetical protein